MNWKLLTAIILSVVVGFVGFTAFMLWRSGIAFNIETFIAYIIGQSAAKLTGLIGFIVEKWTLVVSAIGGTATTVTLVYKAVSNKINAVKSEKETQLAEVQQMAIQQQQKLGNIIKTQETQITQLEAKVEAQKDLAQDYETSQQLNTQLRTQNKDLQSTVKTYENTGIIKYTKACEAELLAHGLPLPKVDGDIITITKVK